MSGHGTTGPVATGSEEVSGVDIRAFAAKVSERLFAGFCGGFAANVDTGGSGANGLFCAAGEDDVDDNPPCEVAPNSAAPISCFGAGGVSFGLLSSFFCVTG